MASSRGSTARAYPERWHPAPRLLLLADSEARQPLLHDLAWTIERLPEKFRRRVKARGQIRLRKIDGWQKIGAVLNQQSPGRGMVIIRAAFAATVALGLLGAPLAADAQQAGKVYRIGYLSVSQVDFDKSWVGAFRDGLRKLGYVEGQNLVIDQRHAAGHSERLPSYPRSSSVSRSISWSSMVRGSSRRGFPA